jgi:hypothetical protein
MGLERRGRAGQGQPVANPQGEEPGAGPGPRVKSFEIDKRLVFRAWEKVRANNGAPGVDAVSTGLFEEQLKGNLYKLWNRMSSGCYFPGPVRGAGIPKDHAGLWGPDDGRLSRPVLRAAGGETPPADSPGRTGCGASHLRCAEQVDLEGRDLLLWLLRRGGPLLPGSVRAASDRMRVLQLGVGGSSPGNVIGLIR